MVSMGKTQRKEKDILIRREEILDAAERLYEKDDFESVTMDRIAGEAEFTKQTLYAYFEGKDEIFNAVYLRAARTVSAAFTEKLGALGEEASGFERMDTLREVFVKAFMDHPLYIRMMAVSQAKDMGDYAAEGIYDEIAQIDSAFEEKIAGCIMRGISDGSMKPGLDPVSVMLYLKACISGMLNMVTYNKEHIRSKLKLEMKDIMEKVFRFAMLALKNN
jgi:AcrR family transcriptional regulator